MNAFGSRLSLSRCPSISDWVLSVAAAFALPSALELLIPWLPKRPPRRPRRATAKYSMRCSRTRPIPRSSAQALAADPGIGRAEALRRAMLRVMIGAHRDGRSRPRQADPIFRAAFVEVGEGGAGR
jgi:hypothetical protein